MPAMGDYQHLEVHLGNVWEEPPAARTIRLAALNPDTYYIGIDKRELNGVVLPPNLDQRVDEFCTGLGKLRPGSCDRIESAFAIGYYASSYEDYDVSSIAMHTKIVIEAARPCLKSGGMFQIYITEEWKETIDRARPSVLGFSVDERNCPSFDSTWGITFSATARIVCYTLIPR